LASLKRKPPPGSVLGYRRHKERGMIPEPFRRRDELGSVAFEHCFD
jgi:hypothetical protein